MCRCSHFQRYIVSDPVWWLPGSPRSTWRLWYGWVQAMWPTAWCLVWVSGGLCDSEVLGLSGLGWMDTFVSQPAVEAPSLFTAWLKLSWLLHIDELPSVPLEFSIHSDPITAWSTPTCTDSRTPVSLARETHADSVNFGDRWEVLYTAIIVESLLGLSALQSSGIVGCWILRCQLWVGHRKEGFTSLTKKSLSRVYGWCS